MKSIKLTVELMLDGRYKNKYIIETGDGRPVVVERNMLQEAVETIVSEEEKRVKK